ncbi:MAG TPA: AAA family ATPase [Candidatus Dormibacteraeota bacterium]
MPDPTLFGLVVDQLAAQPPQVAGAGDLVLAAFEGSASLQATLAGAQSAMASPATAAPPRPPGVFLRAVEVEGFRGVGPPVSLEVPPGPGLTLVVGRNGSGKSSLAEALEMLLTGSNQRWAARPKVWADGWRNLHHRPPRITATFAVDGRSAPMTVARTWADGADVSASSLTVDGKRRSLEEGGWDHALRSYPPLLSHNELGRILEGKPTELYDALASILGLADIAAAEALLRNERVNADRVIKEQQRAADDICARVGSLDDERAEMVLTALSRRAWDLNAVQQVIAGGLIAVEERTALQTLRELTTLAVVDRERVRQTTARLRELNEEIGRLGGSDAAAARDTALLLEQALRVDAPHQGLSCPVCGSPGVLTYEWRLKTTTRIAELREQAMSVERVHREATEIRTQARHMIQPVSGALTEAASVGVDASAALAQWQRWSSAPGSEDLLALSTHLDTVAPDLIAAVAGVRSAAGAELERREDRWRPVAQTLIEWLPAARRAEEERARMPRLKAAEAWIKDAHEALRRQRFEPIAGQVQENWQELRQSGSVQLGELRLEGTGTSNLRRLTLDVSIDGENGSALGVMSQGELNCLALSLFLPRASMPESPFRFLVIDDPVQAMDPVKVEGLARVLHRVSQKQQVVVLTHDDRLADAVRRLNMEATIIEVSRRENSVVELRTDLDPVKRHIDDALAVAMSSNLPPEARRVVPGFCRHALEAACAAAVTQRMLHDGRTHAEIESALQVPTTLMTWLAMALLKDTARSGEVMGLLNRSYPWAADVVGLANRGSHTGIPADLLSLVRSAERLSKLIREVGSGAP